MIRDTYRFNSEQEAQDYAKRMLACYPHEGYGTLVSVFEYEGAWHCTVKRAVSCD